MPFSHQTIKEFIVDTNSITYKKPTKKKQQADIFLHAFVCHHASLVHKNNDHFLIFNDIPLCKLYKSKGNEHPLVAANGIDQTGKNIRHGAHNMLGHHPFTLRASRDCAP